MNLLTLTVTSSEKSSSGTLSSTPLLPSVTFSVVLCGVVFYQIIGRKKKLATRPLFCITFPTTCIQLIHLESMFDAELNLSLTLCLRPHSAVGLQDKDKLGVTLRRSRRCSQSNTEHKINTVEISKRSERHV